MTRDRAAHIILAVLLLAFVPAAAQLSAADQVACPRAAFSPVLDGRLEGWPRVPQAVVASAEDWHPAAAAFAEYGGPEDISADVRLYWDNQALYLALETLDDDLVRVRSAAEIDRGDSIVLGIAGKGASESNQFVVALLSAASLVWRAEPTESAGEVRTIGRALWARQTEEGGTRVTYEMAIPWSELRQIRPVPGGELSLTVSVCDDDGAGLEGCLERQLSVALSAAGIAPGETAIEPGPPASLPPIFPAPNAARFDENCFVLDGRDVLVLAGQIDYARLPSETWADRIEMLRSAGFNAVALTVPWAHHQPTPETPDLSGLRQFLELCQGSGLWVQLNIGPYAGEDWEAGGVPGWAIAGGQREERGEAAEQWFRALLPVVAEYQLTAGGPGAYVVARPLPDEAGDSDVAALERLFARLRSAEIAVPVLTANVPAARHNATQTRANILDTLSFYTAAAPGEIASGLKALTKEENGPAVISALPGDYRSTAAARRSLDVARVALASGARAIAISDFAPGLDASLVRPPGDWTARGIVDPAGARTPGYGEVKLLASFLRQFGPQLARAAPAEGLAESDDPAVRVAAFFGPEQSFLFLWDEEGRAGHQVRLSYIEPGTEVRLSIPKAGAINLPAGGAKILPLDVPLDRAVLRHTTSEIAGIHRLGERTLLVVYGEADTPGEIALRMPGPPLVTGEVTRQHWDPETKTLVLDYYHGRDDRYILVDEFEVVVLSRARAAMAGTIGTDGRAITLSAGAHLAGGSLDSGHLKAMLDCPAGSTEVTAAVPDQPSSVTVDGEPVDFTFTTPARVLKFEIETETFERSQRPASLWEKLGRSIAGGPPKLYARFDRGSFMPDAAAERSSWEPIDGLGRLAETLGLTGGGFARLRTRLRTSGAAEMIIGASGDPILVFVNGEFVPALSGSGSSRQADISPYLRGDGNQVELLVHLLPRQRGAAGLHSDPDRLPQVIFIGPAGEIAPTGWEMSRGLGGEASGWAGIGVDARRWHFIRFGPWREQSKELADVWGVGWYRVPFGLPEPDGWQIPYRLNVTLDGAANLYLNGAHLATCRGDGSYVLPLLTRPLRQGEENVLAAAVYGLAPGTGLHWAEIAADEERMTRRRVVEIRF